MTAKIDIDRLDLMEKLAFDIGEELQIGGGRSVKDIFTDPVTKEASLGYFISSILPNIYVFASIILFFLLIGGGLMVIFSAGQENPEGTANGKKAITAALVGFLIIFASYWIIQIIEVITGIDIFGGGGL